MSDELINILSGSSENIDSEKLLDYLNDKLSDEEKHEFEKNMANSEMLNDIVEGLEKFKNKKDVSVLVSQLNLNLKKQLDKNKSKRIKRKMKELPWLYVTIVVVLILTIIGFVVIKNHLDIEGLHKNLTK